MATVPVKPNLSKVESAIEPIRVGVADLAWVSAAYGLTKAGVNENGQSFPQVYRGDLFHNVEIVPDFNETAIAFFEINGEFSIEYEDSFSRVGTASYPVALVVWINQEKTGNAGYDLALNYCEETMKKIEGIYSSDELLITSFDIRPETLFEKYDYSLSRLQGIMNPFTGFRIDFTLNLPYSGKAC